MQFIIKREKLLKPLQQAANVVSNRPLQPILNNILLKIIDSGHLLVTGSDTEVELVNSIELVKDHKTGSTTVHARKLLEICRSLPTDSLLAFTQQETHLQIVSGRSRFCLATLAATHFPNTTTWESIVEFSLTQNMLKRLVESTQFAMAQQDIRHHLNGMLFETDAHLLRTVATDGHRLACCSTNTEQALKKYTAIVSRKGVLELARLLETNDAPIQMRIGSHNLQVMFESSIFTCRLINGRFPDYRLALPKQTDKFMCADNEKLRQTLMRAAILSNEKYRCVKFLLTHNQLKITANNPNQEEVEEILDVHYISAPLEISLNVFYLLDVLNVLKSGDVKLYFTNALSGVLINGCNVQDAAYVVMPMQL